MKRTHLCKVLYECAFGWLIMPVGIAAAAGVNGEKDDRDAIHEAQVYHIMLRDRGSAEALRSKLSQAPTDDLLPAFKALAKSESLDPSSAPSGGNLGIVREGEFDKAFETGVFSQTVNAVSEPIKSPFGWHLVYLTAKSNRPVLDVCRESLAGALARAKPQERKRLQLSMKSDLMQLQPELVQFLGGKWSKPFVDWNENLAFFKKLPKSSGSSRVHLLIHTEYLHPIYKANPLSCKRSLQEVFEIDCETGRVALRKREEFEGRGAVGQKLSEVKLPKTLPSVSAGPNGYYRQLITQVCSR